jgi:ABC-type transport system involved in multi-copper enzyme maturation permease subunit
VRSRWGLGPVFVYEWLTAARRWQMYALRALFVGVLFLAVVIVWFKHADPLVNGAARLDRKAHAEAGEALFYAFFGTLLSVVLLLAPGATAGAVCLDKARGALVHLLVTDLSSREIVFGKMAVRLIPLFGLVLASVPVLSLCLWLGGIDPDAMMVAYAVTAGVAVLGSSVAFLLSVWGRKTHEVLLATYLFEVLLLLAYPISFGLDPAQKQTWLSPYLAWTNPFRLAFSPYLYRGATDLTELMEFLGFCLGIGAVCALLSVATIRSVTVRQSSQPQRRRRRLLPWLRRPWWLTPRLDGNPVYWREWHRQRPSRWVRIVWAVYVIMAMAGTASIVYEQAGRTRLPGSEFGAIVSAFQVCIGLLLASVAAVTSLSEERVRGSLDVLLTTPLKTRSIVWGKWRGAFRIMPWLALLPAVNVALTATPGNVPPWTRPGAPPLPPLEHPNLIWWSVPLMYLLVLCYGAAVTSFGLACATWFQRQGRAVAISVLVYALVTVGWVAFVAAVFDRRESVEGLMIASPFYGPGILNAESSMTYRRAANGMPQCTGAVLAWGAGYLAVALLLYLVVLGTFNRCLGRMSERPFTVPPLGGPRFFGPRFAPPLPDSDSSAALPRFPEHVVPSQLIEMPAEDEQQI